jgi:type II secretory pathway component PulK
MTRLRRLFREEQGFALVIVLGVTVVFGLMVVTVIESARSNSRSSTMSVGRMSAYTLPRRGSTTRCRLCGSRRTMRWTTTSSAR